MYTALGTRPDLAFIVQHLNQFTISHGQDHWTAVKHALCYLKSTHDAGIVFKKDANMELELYVDSDFANRADTLSIGRYVAMLGGGYIAWSSKKQRTISLSTIEYIALTEGAKQLIWLCHALLELGFNQNHPTSICSDNLGAITLSHDATYYAQMKHINVAHHFIHEKVASNKAALTYIRSKENTVDIMTKGLKLHQHKYLCEKLRMETP